MHEKQILDPIFDQVLDSCLNTLEISFLSFASFDNDACHNFFVFFLVGIC